MIFFPIRTDRRQLHTPWVNYALIALNVVAFAYTNRQVDLPEVIESWMLFPSNPNWRQFVTYQFLHSGYWHLVGNMMFLYVFGNNLEDRLGKISYLAFYLAGGVISGLGHCLASDAPVLGASGSVCAVTGAYLILFPKVYVTIFYWFFYIGTFEVTSLFLIGVFIAQDLLQSLGGGGGVAYEAHLAGYAFGVVIASGLLLTRLLPREPYDLLALIEHRRRKQQFRQLTQRGYRPWDFGQNASAPPQITGELTPQQKQLADLRSQISRAVAGHDLDHAARCYIDLLAIDAKQTLSQPHQLDVANHLMSDGRYEQAARAYELFLDAYKTYAHREQVELILGLIYARYLSRPPRARELLNVALPRLHDDKQRELARQALSALKPDP